MEKNTTTSAVKKKRFVMELSTSEAVGWAALVIFVCGWFFVLGIFVGRGLVPIPGEKEPDRPYFAKGDTPFPEPAQETVTVDSLPSGPSGGQESSKPVPPTVSAEAVKTVPEKVPPVTSAEEKEPPRDKEPPPADSPPKATPAGIAVTTSPADKVSGNKPAGKIFTIQVAAVRERRAADQCYEKLKKNKYAPDTVQTIQSGGVTWYRLRCGQFASHDEAAPVIERLRKDGFSPILVRR